MAGNERKAYVAADALDGLVSPGTRLVRHWHGAEHIVTATADGGLEYQGKRYRTLTAVAKVISGQHCSGPRFFGLVGREAS